MSIRSSRSARLSAHPSENTSARGQSPIVIFVVLLLVLAGLLLITTNIDPKSTIRPVLSATPSPTPDVLAATNGYTAYQSPDGVLKIEYPAGWSPVAANATNPLTYVFTPTGSNSVLVGIRVLAPTALGIQGITDTSTPKQILTQAQPQLSAKGEAPLQLRDVTAGALSGTGYHRLSAATANTAAQETELWLLSLDSTHVILIQAIASPSDWTGRLEPLFQHMMATLSMDVKAALAAAPKPTPTGAATVAPTAATK